MLSHYLYSHFSKNNPTFETGDGGGVIGPLNQEEQFQTQNEESGEPFQSFQIKSKEGKEVKKEGQRKRKMKEQKFEWRDEIVEILIDLWQNQPLLFDAGHPNYHVKEKRRNCINGIISSLGDQGVMPLPSYDEV